MYLRSEVCELTGIQPERFKTLLRRDQLPVHFILAKERAWYRYSSEEVLAVALAEQFMCKIGYADGLPPGVSTAIVEGTRGLMFKPFAARRRDWWIGYVGFDKPNGGQNLAGTLPQIFRKVAVKGLRLFLVNVDETLREIKARAQSAGIAFPAQEPQRDHSRG